MLRLTYIKCPLVQIRFLANRSEQWWQSTHSGIVGVPCLQLLGVQSSLGVILPPQEVHHQRCRVATFTTGFLISERQDVLVELLRQKVEDESWVRCRNTGIYIYIFVVIYIYIYIFIYIYRYVYIYIFIYLYKYLHIYIYLYIFIYLYLILNHFRYNIISDWAYDSI